MTCWELCLSVETWVQENGNVPSQAFKSKSAKNLFPLKGLFIILSFALIQCYVGRKITGANVMWYSKAASHFFLFGSVL